MKDKDLLKQLNILKEVKPDSKWKDENRGVLMNQIYGAQTSEVSHEFNLFQSFMKTLPRYVMDLAGQPSMVVVFILVLVFGGSAVSVKFAHNSKPGDSLYIAKIVSERTKEAFTFSDKEKTQLVIKHAQNRADELHQVLAESNYDNDQAEKLVGDFQNEIKKAKTRLEKMNTIVAVNPDNQSGDEIALIDENLIIEEEEPQEIFTVNSEKNDNGMQVLEPNSTTEEPVVGEAEGVVEEESVVVSPSEMLKEAGELLIGDNYTATLDKLTEANDAIEKSIIKEEIAPASSTEEMIEEDVASSTEGEKE